MLPDLSAVAWHTLGERDAIQTLGSDLQQGLSLSEVSLRHSHYGPNQLTTKAKMPAWRWQITPKYT